MSIRFSYENLLDKATLTPSSQVSTLPATHLQDQRPTKVWRTTGCSSENLVIDCGEPVAATVIALLCYNLSTNAQVSLEANSSDSWSSPPFSKSLPYHNSILIRFFSQETYRYWRLTFADSGNPDGYLQVGRVWLGTHFQPARDFSKDFTFQRVDPSVVAYSDSGSRVVTQRTPYRQLKLQFPNTNQKDEFSLFLDTVGLDSDFIVALDPTNSVWSDGLHDYSFYCHLAEIPDWSHKIMDRWSLGLILRESV